MDITGTRLLPRYELDFPVPVYLCHGSRPIAKGVIRDISSKGAKISGLEAKVGEIKTFIVPTNNFSHVEPFAFQAECRWVDGDGSTAGFQIIKISTRGWGELQKLIRFLTLRDDLI